MTTTIIASASGNENVPVGIIRISGPQAWLCLKDLFVTKRSCLDLIPRHAYFGSLWNFEKTEKLDEGLLLYFKAPASYTGEDVLEWQGHGNIFLLQKIIKTVLAQTRLNLRLAKAGEFSQRAFLNGKINLSRAEAICEIISAENESTLKMAMANFEGRIEQEVLRLKQMLLEVLAHVEAQFEFTEEDILTYSATEVQNKLGELKSCLQKLLQSHESSSLLTRGLRVSLVGAPNVGKSSLLNLLLNENRALVSEHAGTTRDVVSGSRNLQGCTVHFFDTAGLHQTQDVIEKAGIEKTLSTAQKSDVIFVLTDNLKREHQPELAIETKAQSKIYYILNKADLHNPRENFKGFDAIVSAKTGQGLEALRQLLLDEIKNKHHDTFFHVNLRQFQCLKTAEDHVNYALEKVLEPKREEFLAQDLRQIIKQLDLIIGNVCGDEILGEIFSRFCIGK